MESVPGSRYGTYFEGREHFDGDIESEAPSPSDARKAADAKVVEAFRREYRERFAGRFYNGWLHAATTFGIGAAAIGLGLSQVRRVRPQELAVVPAALLFANAVEWAVHKELLHHLRPGLFVLYSRHALNHHEFFNSERMTFDGSDDFRIVFFPPFAILASIGGTAALGAGLARFSRSRNAGLLFCVTGTAFYLLYEIMHLCEHLPESAPSSRIPLVAYMRRHHARHHDKRRMVEHNFNLTFPLADALLGTLASASSSQNEFHPVFG
jgi:hypothetical protein